MSVVLNWCYSIPECHKDPSEVPQHRQVKLPCTHLLYQGSLISLKQAGAGCCCDPPWFIPRAPFLETEVCRTVPPMCLFLGGARAGQREVQTRKRCTTPASPCLFQVDQSQNAVRSPSWAGPSPHATALPGLVMQQACGALPPGGSITQVRSTEFS